VAACCLPISSTTAALAYRKERLRLGDDYAGKGDPGYDKAMRAYCRRHPEFNADVHADRLVVSRRVAALLRYAYEIAGQWVNGGPMTRPEHPTQLARPDWE
jgi:hypothetical protein